METRPDDPIWKTWPPLAVELLATPGLRLHSRPELVLDD